MVSGRAPSQPVPPPVGCVHSATVARGEPAEQVPHSLTRQRRAATVQTGITRRAQPLSTPAIRDKLPRRVSSGRRSLWPASLSLSPRRSPRPPPTPPPPLKQQVMSQSQRLGSEAQYQHSCLSGFKATSLATPAAHWERKCNQSKASNGAMS